MESNAQWQVEGSILQTYTCNLTQSFFAERFFALFDSDGSGTISLDELLKALNLLIHGDETDKLRFLFQVYDVDGSGSIDPDELRTVLKSCLKESTISLPEEKLDDLTLALFESADKDNNGSITFEELKEELECCPEVMENLTISAANWLKPPAAEQKSHTPRYLTPAYWHNNRSKLLFMGSYLCLNTLLFTWAALRHTPLGGWVMVAKGCGQCLNFNCTFLGNSQYKDIPLVFFSFYSKVLMLRRCLTWLRATWVAKVFPLDQSVLFHQLVGYVVGALTAVHTGAHVGNFVIRYCCDLQVFYWTHLSYISIWALLILHGPNFWKWFVVPGFLFVVEKTIGIAVSRMGGLYVVEINLLPSKVTHLVIKRPQFFHYKPGDYVYLNIPAIAKYEWHPFTISSAPEQQVRLTQIQDRPALWEYLFTTRPGIGWIHGSASLTGIALQLLICMMLVCSSTFVRKGGHFEVFYWTHLSYISIWALLILHGPNFWKWFVVPGFLFVVEKTIGIAVSRMGGLYVVEINLLPSKVTHLVIKRPQFFHYKPGDYVYLNIPAIAKYEWHPFTISSAPEQQDTIWLHIRSQGQWTSRLYEYFRWPEPLSQEPKRLMRNLRKQRYRKWTQVSAKLSENHRVCNIKCYIDGPYGTPTRRIFTSEHAVLVGAGIGITPFASILQSIMYRYRMRKQNDPRCGYSWSESLKDDEMKLRKVDFIWINRDQKSFEWFVSLLTKLEMDQADEEPEGRFLEMHLYMTSALSKNDMKAIGLQMALDLLAKKEKKDSITGLRTRTQPGRPDWSKGEGSINRVGIIAPAAEATHIPGCRKPALIYARRLRNVSQQEDNEEGLWHRNHRFQRFSGLHLAERQTVPWVKTFRGDLGL
ncbi:NADPH oxidase 5 [Chelonia mydas]|uniref:NADPH oxidase 5 n=1 Tax=Chelonia mydas TaxID=8469 RepID=M7BVC6_CHEMY|nr:NADPH oxidase 5 [Chelonia mydas]